MPRVLLSGLAVLIALGSVAHAADVPVVGTSLLVQDNPVKPAARKAVFKSTAAAISVGANDPRVTGVSVELVNSMPGLEQSDVFTLPASGWKAIGTPPKGYRYKDSKLLNGPVKSAIIRNGRLVKLVAKGATMTFTLDGVPQTQIGVVVTVGTTRLCSTFGGTISKDDGGKFKAKLAAAPGVCPGLPTTTTTTSTISSTTTTQSSTTTTEPATTTTESTTTTTGPSSTTTTTTTTVTTTTLAGGVDPNSPVSVTSACLTNGTGAQLAVKVMLFDTNADPVVGATVSIGSTAGTVGPVQSSGNLYWATLTAPASGTSAQIGVIADGQPLVQQPTVTLAAPFTDAAGGSGGCAQDGNMRVRVLDETGAPLAGASVLLGSVEQTNVLVTTYGSPADGATTAVTDAQGYAVFRDFGATLAGPVTVTAGATNRRYLTLSSVDASDVVLPLAPIVPAVTTGTLSGDVTGISSSGNVEVGVVLGDVTLDTLASFNLNSLLADSSCYASPAGNFATPGNVFIPSQTVLVIVSLPKKSFLTAPLTYGQRRMVALGGNVPLAALTGGGGIAAALTQLAFTNITAETVNVASPGPTAKNFAVSSFGSTTACTATGAPGTDAFCIAALDWDGNSSPTRTVGEGPLGVFSFKAATAPGGVVNLTGVNFRAKTAGAPNPFTAVGHLGATVSLNLDTSLVTIPPGTANGVSVVLKRDFPSDTLPASFAYGAMYPIRVHTQTARTLALDTPAGLTGVQYVKHTLAQEISTAYTACVAGDSTRVQNNALWDVYAPATTASVTLPTLPASFPRATLSGNLPGLIDPTATVEDDKITWSSTTIREGLNGSFSYDGLRLGGFRKYGTNFTTNSGDYVP